MLYQLSYHRILSGRGWIRTTEGINQQIYSLPHLATLEHARNICCNIFNLVLTLQQILSLLSDSNQRPRDYKSRALAN